MDFVAHTPPKENPGLEPHGYAEHIREALACGVPMFERALSHTDFSVDEKAALTQTFKAALMLHDMGKLDEDNQKVLRGETTGRLPVDHIEAGVAVAAEMGNELLGWLIRGHHSPGLPNKSTEKAFIRQLKRQHPELTLGMYSLRGKRHKRDKNDNWQRDWQNHADAIRVTDKRLSQYKQRQRDACGDWPQIEMPLPSSALLPRMMLSCLVDADHGSAAYYSQGGKGELCQSQNAPDGRWNERLDALDRYVAGLARPADGTDDSRNILRGKFYDACRHGPLHASRLACCSAPVGLGKTTSVLAYLLRCAAQGDLSRIFIIAPFSNIIDQTVKTLRKAVILDGEAPEKAVVAHHHKADFRNKDMRQYAASWNAPIVVTTSVQFFETLAESNPTRLRKLHNVAGSAIFIDESHACLPAKLLDISWCWIKQLATNWGCHTVFSSGSIVRFWENEHLVSENRECLPDILPESLRSASESADKQRFSMKRLENPLGRDQLVEAILPDSAECADCLSRERPSCLVILNTVQSAAVVADGLATRLNDGGLGLKDKRVLHLSTALTPEDRETILRELNRRQSASKWDAKPWYLVATSCVEAGVDLDFAIGFRETCSVSSFIQVSGRVNRHGKRELGLLYDFSIIPDNGLIKHPGFKESSAIFHEMWDELTSRDIDDSRLCTKAAQNEFLGDYRSRREEAKALLANEKLCAFQDVSKDYKLIDSGTFTVVVRKDIVEKMEMGYPVNWRDIQRHSVQLWANKIKAFGLTEVKGCEHDDVYAWPYDYDREFLGVMKSVLENKAFTQRGGAVL